MCTWRNYSSNVCATITTLIPLQFSSCGALRGVLRLALWGMGKGSPALHKPTRPTNYLAGGSVHAKKEFWMPRLPPRGRRPARPATPSASGAASPSTAGRGTGGLSTLVGLLGGAPLLASSSRPGATPLEEHRKNTHTKQHQNPTRMRIRELFSSWWDGYPPPHRGGKLRGAHLQRDIPLPQRRNPLDPDIPGHHFLF